MANPVLDRLVPGLGRIKKTYGTSDPDTVKGISVMVTHLIRTSQLDILKAVQDGRLSLLPLYNKWRTQKLREVSVDAAMPIQPAFDNWVSTNPALRPITQKKYREFLQQLLKNGTVDNMDQLPDALKAYRKRCYKKGAHRMFNAVRNMTRSFVKGTLGENSTVYNEIKTMAPLQELHQQARARTVPEVLSSIQKLSQPLKDQFLTMCFTGAGMAEYMKGLEVEGNGIRIKGDKMARVDDRRNRLVPHTYDPAPLILQAQALRRALIKAGSDLQIYDARRCFARWCLEAGIPLHRVKQFMGHRPLSITERYALGAVDAHLKADADLLRAYIERGKAVEDVNTNASKWLEW